MEKHCFGNPVSCIGCSSLVSAVYATSTAEASAGQGFCEQCLTTPYAPPAMQGEADPAFVADLDPSPDEAPKGR